MKRHLTSVILLLVCFVANAQYDISVKVDGVSCSEKLILAHHQGDKQYADANSTCKDGVFHFTGSKSLKTGLYLVILPDKNYFEIVVSQNEDQTKYSVVANSQLNVSNFRFSGSKENELFFNYVRYYVAQTQRIALLEKQKIEGLDDEKLTKINTQIAKVKDETSVYRRSAFDSDSTLFTSKYLLAANEVPMVETPADFNKSESNKYKYKWIRKHYWDNVDFSEDGLVKSPIFHKNLSDYFNKYTSTNVDTAIQMADVLLANIKDGGSQEQYKYATHFITGYFEKSKRVCFDKALWYMAKNYFCDGKADWVDTSYQRKSCEVSNRMGRIICGAMAADMSMPDTSFENRKTLYEIDKPVTVVVFWDINCLHCKMEMPILQELCDTMGNENFEIYAVYAKEEWEDWKKRVTAQKYKFINVSNVLGDDNFMTNYSLDGFPEIFILDRDKNIRFKKVAAHDVGRAVEYLLKEQGVK